MSTKTVVLPAILLAAFSVASFAQSGPLTVVQPNGGESASAGGSYAISWNPGDRNPTRFDVFASYDNGATWKKLNLTGKIAIASYEWSVPAFPKNKTRCKVKVVGYNEAGTTRLGTDVSDAPFSIDVLDLVSPAGGEVLPSGQATSVSWKTFTQAPVETAALFYTLDGGASWKAIGESADSGTFAWMLPQLASTARAKVRVDLKDPLGNKVATAASETPFTIQVQPKSSASLQGDFFMMNASVSEPASSFMNHTVLATVAPNGSGSADFSVIQSSSGSTDSGTVGYAVAADGQMTVTAQGETLHGVVSRNNDVFMFADTTLADQQAGLFMAIRKSTSLDPSVIEGTWISGESRRNPSTGETEMQLAEITVGQGGSGAFHCLWASDVSGCQPDSNFTITSYPDGRFTIGEPGFVAVVSPDGRIFEMVDTDGTGSALSYAIGIKKPPFTPAPGFMSGKYTVNILGADGSGSWVKVARVKCDGAGALTYADLFTTASRPDSGPGTYAIDPGTGLFTVNDTLKGMVSDDGQAFLLIEIRDSDHSASMITGIKTVK